MRPPWVPPSICHFKSSNLSLIHPNAISGPLGSSYMRWFIIVRLGLHILSSNWSKTSNLNLWKSMKISNHRPKISLLDVYSWQKRREWVGMRYFCIQFSKVTSKSMLSKTSSSKINLGWSCPNSAFRSTPKTLTSINFWIAWAWNLTMSSISMSSASFWKSYILG